MEHIDPATVVFAIVAIFVAWKLRQVLGTRTGAERRPMDSAPPPPPGASPADNVISIGAARRAPTPPNPPPDRWRGVAEPGTPLAQGLDAIASGEPQFNPADFLNGARGAYEMIVGAFAAGDLDALRRLLSPDVLQNFARAIEARRAAGQTMKSTLVSIDKAEIVDARVAGRDASVSVRFAAKLISATLDATGAVVEGSDTTSADHLDVWTFSRQIGARDPNWLLTATQTVH
jgi:predicted lipid-binding transport protein (Tim44 family)